MNTVYIPTQWSLSNLVSEVIDQHESHERRLSADAPISDMGSGNAEQTMVKHHRQRRFLKERLLLQCTTFFSHQMVKKIDISGNAKV